ncbi:MAG: outer membrane protein transport protein, partial [Gammaproteobacteria bacterium]|nr:outer membrane protein transport protein [Gammaproteobacteria bacterium]
RIGAIYELQPGLRLGAQFTSPLYMQRYTKYNGLFAGNGSMDSPAHCTLGIAWSPVPALTVGFDVQRVFFGDIEALANRPVSGPELAGVITPARMLGGSKGFGFGWTNETVYKLGAIYQPDARLTLRAGWNHTPSVIPESSGLFGPIMPSIMEDHLAAGLSWRLDNGHEITFGYMHALGNTLEARHTAFFGSEVDTWASTDSFDFGYSWKF